MRRPSYSTTMAVNVSDKARIISSFTTPKMEALTSLPLQMSLHFNAYFTPFLIGSSLIAFVIKYSLLSVTYQVILIAVLFVYFLVEIIRLYLGFYGNLGENIPALSGFWITTLILQLPITQFLLWNSDIRPLPMERIAYSFHTIFIVVQIVSGFVVIRRIADFQVEEFKRKVLEEVDESAEK